jgi:membrane protein
VTAVALWWRTPHLLLLGRIGWRRLLPTAVITGVASTLLGIGSELFLPYATRRSVAEYGPFGVVLTLMSRLLVSAGVIVIGGAVGRIAADVRSAEPAGYAAQRPQDPGI